MMAITITITITERQQKKSQEGQLMYNTIAHPLANAQPMLQQGMAPSSHSMSLCSMEYTHGQFRSPVLAMLHLSSLCIYWLPECGKLKSPQLTVGTTEQQLNHHCITHIILTLSLKHSSVPATKKKIRCLPAKTRT